MKTRLPLLLLTLAAGLPLLTQAQTKSITADTTLARKWYTQAIALQQKARYDSANVLFKQASDLYQRHHQWEQKIDCQNKIARGSYESGKIEEAFTKASQALQESITNLGKGQLCEAEAMNILGVLLYMKGEYSQALNYTKQALQIRVTVLGDHHPDIAKSYNNIGNIYQDKGEYHQALVFYRKALDLRLELLGDHHPDIAKSYNNIGNVYSRKGEYDQALTYYLQAIGLERKILGDEHPDVARSYNNIGNLYQYRGEFDQALIYHGQALTLRRKTLGDEHPDVASSYHNMGNVYSIKGEFDQALVYHVQALKLKQKTLGEYHPSIARSYHNIGNVYQDKGEYDQALTYYLQALELRKKILGDHHPDIAKSYSNIGNIYQDKGEYHQALVFYRKALDLRLELLGEKHPDIADVYNNIGDIHDKRGNYDQALSCYQKAVLDNVSSFTDTLSSSNPLLDRQNSSYFDGQVLLASFSKKAAALQRLYTTSSFKEHLQWAYSTCLTADTLVQQIGQHLSTEQDKLQLTANATELYQEGVATGQQLYKLTRNEDYLKQAFYFAERGKASVLSASLAESKARSFAGIPDSLLRLDQRLRAELSRYGQGIAEEQAKGAEQDSSRLQEYQSKLFIVHGQQDSLVRRFEQEYPQYYQLKYQSATVSPAQLQGVLDEQTAVVEYVLTDTTLYAFTLTKTAFTLRSLRLDSTFTQQLTALRESILSRDFALYQKLAHRLYGQLWPQSLPRTIKRIILIPDGPLHTLPFEALLSGEAGTKRSAAYLLKKYAISYAYSATLLYGQLVQPVRADNRHLLALAPVFADAATNAPSATTRSVLARHQSAATASLPPASNAANSRSRPFILRSWLKDGRYVSPLPASVGEVQTIAALFEKHGGKARVYLHGQAREAQVKAPDIASYHYLHLATHGFANETQPELSGVLLAQDSTAQEDGVLYAGELYNLSLNAELVTLSACETGLGKVARGEGIMGLTRALLYAGARNVAVSLWQVPDESTAQLMKGFYWNLLKGQSKADALRRAKRQLLKQRGYAAPHFWAPFILVGY